MKELQHREISSKPRGSILWNIIKWFNNSKNKTIAPTTKGIKLNRTLNIENPFSGVFISGNAGSGKSKSLVEPIIYHSGSKGYTGVVYDFKYPELARHVATAYANSHVQTYYINFGDMNYTDRINPIAPELMKNDSFAREFAFSVLANLNPSMIQKLDFWSDNSIALLTSVFCFLKAEYPQYCTLPHAISLILNSDSENLMEMLQTNEKSADIIKTILITYKRGADNQISELVVYTLQVALSKINTPEIYFITSESDFSLNVNDPNTPSLLTIGNDPRLENIFAPIIGLILTSLSKQLNQPNKEQSLFLIDEFPTVFIPKVEQLTATGRSNKIATVLACHDIAQIVNRYGKDKADTILSNLGNQFYGRTTNLETAERISSLFGKADKLQTVQDVATLETGSFYAIISEGATRQGKTSIPLKPKISESDLPQKRSFTEEQIENNFKIIKQEAKEILLKYAAS